MDRFLQRRHALIVGGSGGIGAAVSLGLARAGASLCIHGGTNQAGLDSVVNEAIAAGATARGMLREITDADAAEKILADAGRVDVIIIAFGPYLEASLHETRPEQWRRMVELNLLLPAFLISRAVPEMQRRSYGRVVVFGGPRADRVEGFRTIGAYAAAKAGLASLVRSAARQYAADNVTCNMISPGYVATEYQPEGRLRKLAAARPAGRLVSTEEIAHLCLTLLRPESSSVNGAIIPVDFGE